MKAKAAPPADRRKPILYVTLAVIVIGLIVAVGYLSRNPSIVPQAATEAHPQAQLKVGDTAPQFAVSTTAGPFDLANSTTPVFLEVFATWCPHCQHEVPILDGLNTKYGKRVQFVGVSGSALGIDGNVPESQADVINFVGKFGVTYPVAYDPDLTVAKQYLSTGFPTIVVIGKDKKVKAILDGEIPQAQLEKAIQDVL
ncbi:MAG: TlpA disulfide reductase family protein [Candidatus Velthaea sp.]|jgi:thiol-disulfide isomerase/thioredoxin